MSFCKVYSTSEFQNWKFEMEKLAIRTLLIAVFFQLSTCSWNDDCPNIPTKANFDPKKYVGKWYEIQRGPRLTTYFEEGLKCVQAEYTYIDERNILVNNGGIMMLVKFNRNTYNLFSY